MIVGHLRDDDEGGDRCLHDTREIGHHPEKHDGPEWRAGKELGHVGAEARADRE